jgi:hypothetical protein
VQESASSIVTILECRWTPRPSLKPEREIIWNRD